MGRGIAAVILVTFLAKEIAGSWGGQLLPVVLSTLFTGLGLLLLLVRGRMRIDGLLAAYIGYVSLRAVIDVTARWLLDLNVGLSLVVAAGAVYQFFADPTLFGMITSLRKPEP